MVHQHGGASPLAGGGQVLEAGGADRIHGASLGKRKEVLGQRPKPTADAHHPPGMLMGSTAPEDPMDRTTIKARLKQQRIETPSWGYSNCGTRFGTFIEDGAARTLSEKFEDAGLVHRLTGVTPTIALHIPWDTCADWSAAKAEAATQGIAIGAINPNVFQDQCYKLGSICSPDAKARASGVAAMLQCVDVMKATGSDILSLWFADGTNYPGQDDLRTRKRRLFEGLRQVYAALPANGRMLIEYKCFEPAFYSTDLPDWGMSHLMCTKLGPKAQVLVDTGHHLPGCNIEQIVAILLDEQRLGGFHFNGRKYADDDLTVGAINPYEMFLIYNELAGAEDDADEGVRSCARSVAYMFDQSPALKNRIEATIQSVMFVQECYAKALSVDRVALRAAQAAGDVTGAEEVLKDAYNTDVRPLLAEVRQEMGLDPNPLAAYRRSGHAKRIAEERLARHGKNKFAAAFS
jgi:L-rhamnose isomerase/sugar isomerase